jgi:light-regulated signal transduction histidine kinase (bacteriophytochrome)
MGESDSVIRIVTLPTILANPTQLSLVFQNLIGNAIEFRRPYVQPPIGVSAEKNMDWRTLAIPDNDMGIDSQNYDNIFVIFQRLP